MYIYKNGWGLHLMGCPKVFDWMRLGFVNIYDKNKKLSFENLMNKVNKNEKYLQRNESYTYKEAHDQIDLGF